MKLEMAIAVMALMGGLSIGVSKPEVPEFNLPKIMGDIDFWAGLSTPVRAEKPTKRDEAKLCLALNAYHEARGEGFAGQVAVGQVALRRAGLDYLRVCHEIYKPNQFSWTTTKRSGIRPTGDAWSWSLAAAEESLRWAARPEKFPDYSNHATYYHATSVNPYWTRGLELVAMIGDHRFYR
jgi:spore germination cell wall hydrolase CwlJ-like protein